MVKFGSAVDRGSPGGVGPPIWYNGTMVNPALGCSYSFWYSVFVCTSIDENENLLRILWLRCVRPCRCRCSYNTSVMVSYVSVCCRRYCCLTSWSSRHCRTATTFYQSGARPSAGWWLSRLSQWYQSSLFISSSLSDGDLNTLSSASGR